MKYIEDENCDKIRNILIVSGGAVDTVWAQKWLAKREYDYVIAADSGLQHCADLKIPVNYLVGDYDSVNGDLLARYKKTTETKTYPPEKDYTDTHIALKRAIQLKPECIDIIGATGSRVDHMITNISIMEEAVNHGIFCAIYDMYNKIYQVKDMHQIEKKRQYGEYVSIIPLTSEVELTLKGMKYPLCHAVIHQGESICQSNEIVDENATICVESGKVIVIEAADKRI